MNEWASNYDVMVGIMNVLSDQFGFDSEPIDDLEKDNSSELVAEEVITEVVVENKIDETLKENKEDNVFEEEKKEKKEKKDFTEEKWFKLIQFGVAVICLIVALILDNKGKDFARYMYIAAYAISAYEIFYEVLGKMFHKEIFTEELLMSIASIAALVLGEFAEACGIMMLFTVGEFFEDNAEESSQKVIDNLKEMCPDEASVVLESGEVITKKVEDIAIDDIVLVNAGDKIPVDGIVLDGTSNVDTKALTGESVYKSFTVGDEIFGGTINIDGTLKIKVTKKYTESSIARIAKIVEASDEKKSKSEKFIQKFARIYTPVVIGLAVLLAFIPPIFYEEYSDGLLKWGKIATMLLCVSCPCSLVVSIPLTYFCGVGTAAKYGVMVKSSEYLETLADADTFVFDKTGTLTEGKLIISKTYSSESLSGDLLSLVAICEKNSNHPLAKAVMENVKGDIPEGTDYQEIAGKGIKCRYNGKKLICGNNKLLDDEGIMYPICDQIGTKLYCAYGGNYAGVVIFNDKVRDNAYGAVNELYEYDVINTVMLTGDNKEYAKKVRAELNMKKSYSELLPEGKVEKMEEIIDLAKGKVAYIGDGINDAPVITRSDVGFAMGALGSDIAIESADIVIMEDDLSKVPLALRLAKRTKLIAKENIILSLIIKAVILGLCIGGIGSIWLAMFADVGALIITILNAIRNKMKI